MEVIEREAIKGVAVSTRPRSTKDSYMPVFMAGFNTAKTIGSFLKIPVFEVTHQESHIEAGIWSSKHEMNPVFLSYHISGGTTELILVNNTENTEIIKIGGSSDLNAGQFIDRIGVSMGIKFPMRKDG